MNEKIIEVESAIVSILNESDLPMQVKRLIICEVHSSVDEKCDAIIEEERRKAIEKARKEAEANVSENELG